MCRARLSGLQQQQEGGSSAQASPIAFLPSIRLLLGWDTWKLIAKFSVRALSEPPALFGVHSASLSYLHTTIFWITSVKSGEENTFAQQPGHSFLLPSTEPPSCLRTGICCLLDCGRVQVSSRSPSQGVPYSNSSGFIFSWLMALKVMWPQYIFFELALSSLRGWKLT